MGFTPLKLSLIVDATYYHLHGNARPQNRHYISNIIHDYARPQLTRTSGSSSGPGSLLVFPPSSSYSTTNVDTITYYIYAIALNEHAHPQLPRTGSSSSSPGLLGFLSPSYLSTIIVSPPSYTPHEFPLPTMNANAASYILALLERGHPFLRMCSTPGISAYISELRFVSRGSVTSCTASPSTHRHHMSPQYQAQCHGGGRMGELPPDQAPRIAPGPNVSTMKSL